MTNEPDNCFADVWPKFTSTTNDGQHVQIEIIDSGTSFKCPTTTQFIKWKIPFQSESDISDCSRWMVTLAISHREVADEISCWAQFMQQDNSFIQVPFEFRESSIRDNIQKDILVISLEGIIDKDDSILHNCFIKLILCFGVRQERFFYDVCQFQMKVLQFETQLSNTDESEVREKRQRPTGPHKNRIQRLAKKELEFFCKTNVVLNQLNCRGFVIRINDKAMIGKPKAVIGRTEVPLTLTNSCDGGLDPESFLYKVTADLDPEQFYFDNLGKELYTSDYTTPENNIFIFGVEIRFENGRNYEKNVYEFRTKSKEYCGKKQQYISAMELEAARAHIKDLKIQQLTTVKGDIAYSWKVNIDSCGRYDEGDVVGIFPSKQRDDTYLDLLTPCNYKHAILAGVITRSYYISANCQEDTDESRNPSEKICMMGKVPIKVFGAVKFADSIFASNVLPGVAVTEEQYIADKGNSREKRLLGYSIEENDENEVKLVSCIVSILLSINNDRIERILADLQDKMSEDIERRMEHYDISKGKEVSRRNCRILSGITCFFVIAILCSYFFLSPASPFIKWKCKQGSLSGSVKFHIESTNEEELIRMHGILFQVSKLREKIGVNFKKKQNFTGSYYFNIRKCKQANLRKVLGWFSNPPVYTRAQVFAVTCNCSEIFHYHEYHSWIKYQHVHNAYCLGKKDSVCNQTNKNGALNWLN